MIVVILFIINLILWSFNKINYNEIKEGLTNSGIITMIVSIILAKSLERTMIIEKIILKINSKYIYLIAAILSAFISNTSTFLIFKPIIQHLNKSHLLLSYSVILGGVLSMIGTTNNIVLNSFLIRKIELFDIFKISFPISIVGIIYIYLIDYFYKKKVDALIPIDNLIYDNDNIPMTLNELIFKLKLKNKCGYLYVGNPSSDDIVLGFKGEEKIFISYYKYNDLELIEYIEEITNFKKISSVLAFLFFIISQNFFNDVFSSFISLLFCGLDYTEIIKNINLDLYFMIAFSFPIGIYFEKFNFITNLLESVSLYKYIFLTILFSSIFSQLLTNPSSAIIMYYFIKNIKSIPIRLSIISILMGTNACFSMSFTYPTHILAKKYSKFNNFDFLIIGIPLDIIYIILSTNLIYILRNYL